MGWFTGLKLGWKLLIIVGMLAAIGGTIYAGYSYVQNKDDKIESLQKDITTLKNNQIKLESSNESLSNERDRLIDEAEQNRKQQEIQLDLIRKAQEQINRYDQYLNSSSRKNQKLDLNRSNPEKALEETNAQQQCFIENYSRMDGNCVDGKFVKE